uniref:Uncharacterized protein n=1 Tax=Vespula pensylvanica TaxID=30213 RepID=A0A834N7T4_VESPE|nr:hypothetical protein H0235_016067 [Vespula pensylvanica]
MCSGEKIKAGGWGWGTVWCTNVPRNISTCSASSTPPPPSPPPPPPYPHPQCPLQALLILPVRKVEDPAAPYDPLFAEFFSEIAFDESHPSRSHHDHPRRWQFSKKIFHRSPEILIFRS